MSMSKLTIRYLLNEEGRKKSLLSNGDGKMIQVLTTDEIDEEKLKYAHVDKNGNAYINVGFRFVSERSEDVDKITTEYEVFVDGASIGSMKTNISGKLSISVELVREGVPVKIIRN